MSHYQIISQTSNVLFETQAESFQDCVELAIARHVPLDHADFRFRNMSGFTMDGARMRHADFTGCNLDGANLSEADLDYAVFTDCTLYNTCFAGSALKVCDFMRASFGATDIAGADLSDAAFSNLSCFTLNFASAKSMTRAYFRDVNGQITHMSNPPIAIYGLVSNPVNKKIWKNLDISPRNV